MTVCTKCGRLSENVNKAQRCKACRPNNRPGVVKAAATRRRCREAENQRALEAFAKWWDQQRELLNRTALVIDPDKSAHLVVFDREKAGAK